MDKNFKNEITSRPGGENLTLCYSCGSCTATCPISEIDDSYNPRLIIRKCLLGYKKEVLQSEDLWKCIQCHRCVAHCPQNVKFAEIMRVLRELSVENDYYDKSLLKNIENLDKAVREFRLKVTGDYLNNDLDMKQVISRISGGDRNG